MVSYQAGRIPPIRSEGVVNVLVEIPRGCRNKYEIDKETGLLKLDRYLYASSHYPGDYGFVPETLAEDGDPLDALVMVNEPTFSGCLIEARVLGHFAMTDGGKLDTKVLTVPNSDPLFAEYRGLQDVPPHFLKEVQFFFETYKQLEGIAVESHGWFPRSDTLRIIDEAIDRNRVH